MKEKYLPYLIVDKFLFSQVTNNLKIIICNSSISMKKFTSVSKLFIINFVFERVHNHFTCNADCSICESLN